MDNFFVRTFKREDVQTKTSASAETKSKTSSGNFRDNAVMVRSMKAALNVPAFARAIQVIADTLAQCTMTYQRFDGGRECFVEDRSNKGLATGRRINYLVQVRPNPRMTWTQLVRQATHNMYFRGNAYIYIMRDDGGDIQSFYLCDSGTYNKLSDTYLIQYDANLKTKSNVPSSDIIHLRAHYSNDNGATGMPILEYAWSALSIAATNDQQTLDTAAKGGKVKLLLQEEKAGTMGFGSANKKELEKITSQLNDDVYSKDVMLLNNIANVTPISTNAQQNEMSTQRAFSVKEVSRITGVPPVILMDDTNTSYKSPEAAMQAFQMYCIAPLVKMWENEFDAKIIGPEGYGIFRFHFCTDPLMRLDPKGQAELDEKRLQTGWSLNELRGQYDLPSLGKDGDIHYLSTNLAELGSEKLSGTSSQPSPEGEGVVEPTTKKGGNV